MKPLLGCGITSRISECPQAISPEKYLALESGNNPIAFVDLAAQQDVIRPQLEHNIHTVLNHGKYIMGPEVKALESKLAESYTDGLMGCENLILPFIPEGYKSAWAQYSIIAKDRVKIQNTLKNAGIPNAVYYGKSLHQQLAFQSLGYVEGDMPISERISHSIFSVPMHPYLQDETIDDIVKVLTQCDD